MPGRTVRTANKRKFEEPVAHAKHFDGLSLPTRLKKRPGVELELDLHKLLRKMRLSERVDEKMISDLIFLPRDTVTAKVSAKTSTPAQVTSPLLTTIAQAGAARLTATHGGASGVAPAGKSGHTAEFDDSVFVVDEYTLYNEVKHGDKNSGRLFLCDDLGDDGDYSGESEEYDE